MPNKDCLTLRNCPFCGGEARPDEFYDEYFLRTWSVFCRDCGANIKSVVGVEKAIKAWNRRANDETPSRNPEDCLYYTANSFWGGGCLGTKEIEPCKGAECENWEPKEVKR